METNSYTITGMTCKSCVAKVEATLQNIPTLHHVQVQLAYPQATFGSTGEVDLSLINQKLAEQGKYTLSPGRVQPTLSPLPPIGKKKEPAAELPAITWATYKPLLLIVGFITGVTALAQYPFDAFSGMLWMRHFMAGFFLVFSFFKLLNLRGFASSYAMYDLLAARWRGWGYVYPFVELALGIAYLVHWAPVATNIFTVGLLAFSSLGVIKSNLDRRKIKCACLGDVFNLPMSTVTIIEDLTMVAMAAVMLVW